MARFTDVPLDVGDPNRAVNDLNSAVIESNKPAPTIRRTNDNTQPPAEDPRFAGKSTEEIVNMYRNLESHSGRLASQMGEQRRMLDQLILGKRDSDLRQVQQPTRDPVKVTPADLLANPTEALDRYFQSRQPQGEQPEVQTLKERLNQLEAQLSETKFVTRHKDADAITADPAFARWVAQTPLRQRLASGAAQGNYADADLLLSEWNASNASGNTVTNARDSAQDLARRITTESGNSASETGTGTNKSLPKLKRADLIALRQTNPEKYESEEYQKVILQAYRDGRVID